MQNNNTLPVNKILNFLNQKKTFVFLESSKQDKDNHLSYIFTDPIKIIQTRDIRRIKSCFKQIELAKKKGYYISGFISYEAGHIINKRFQHLPINNMPLIWMGIFKDPLIFNHQSNKFINNPPLSFNKNNGFFNEKYKLNNLKLDISSKDYVRNIKKIKHFIESGETYQVNYTTKYKFNFKGSALALYKKLRNNQAISYGALIKSPEFNILSFSPELFFRQNKNQLMVKPMKGTAVRGINIKEDAKTRKILAADVKNQAENLMIVDLLRNDLGRVSKTSSVKVKKLFEIETYKTLLQMTSTVKSKLKPKTSLFEIFLSLFPCGSITGAPKIKTMEIISKLENKPRGIYTGAIGFFAPNNKAVFNVAIRTIELKNNKGQMGVGSGITYDSNPIEEFKECKLKARFLTMPDFKLIETMLWNKKQGVFLLENHLQRLNQSAGFFNFSFNKKMILKNLNKLTTTFNPMHNYKIRLLLTANSEIDLESSAILKNKTLPDQKITFSKKKTRSSNIFLYHKTTNRTLYDSEYRKYSKLGFFDTIFCNENKQITEGTISNIFIKKNGNYYTPPIQCGVLPGVFRTHFMQKNKAQEKILFLEDLKTADATYCTNAVRGMVKVKL